MTIAIGQKKKALIHIAKKDLHLDEDSYRQILKGVAGVESSTQLTKEGFEKVMKRFQEMGFRGLLPISLCQKGASFPLRVPRVRKRLLRANLASSLTF